MIARSFSPDLIYFPKTRLWYAVGMPAISARVRPSTPFLFLMTRTIGAEGRRSVHVASMRACRLLPGPDMSIERYARSHFRYSSRGGNIAVMEELREETLE